MCREEGLCLVRGSQQSVPGYGGVTPLWATAGQAPHPGPWTRVAYPLPHPCALSPLPRAPSPLPPAWSPLPQGLDHTRPRPQLHRPPPAVLWLPECGAATCGSTFPQDRPQQSMGRGEHGGPFASAAWWHKVTRFFRVRAAAGPEGNRQPLSKARPRAGVPCQPRSAARSSGPAEAAHLGQLQLGSWSGTQPVSPRRAPHPAAGGGSGPGCARPHSEHSMAVVSNCWSLCLRSVFCMWGRGSREHASAPTQAPVQGPPPPGQDGLRASSPTPRNRCFLPPNLGPGSEDMGTLRCTESWGPGPGGGKDLQLPHECPHPKGDDIKQQIKT